VLSRKWRQPVWAGNRWIACGAVGVTRYMGDLLLGQRILALVAEWCLLGPDAGG
jgi:hypothetical protein